MKKDRSENQKAQAFTPFSITTKELLGLDKTYSRLVEFNDAIADLRSSNESLRENFISQQLENEELRKKILEKETTEHTRQKPKTPESTLRQQMLILHYTGILEQLSLDTTKATAELLGAILNRSVQSIKEVLTHIDHPRANYDIKTTENLKYVYKVFNNVGLDVEAQKVKNELDT